MEARSQNQNINMNDLEMRSKRASAYLSYHQLLIMKIPGSGRKNLFLGMHHRVCYCRYKISMLYSTIGIMK